MRTRKGDSAYGTVHPTHRQAVPAADLITVQMRGASARRAHFTSPIIKPCGERARTGSGPCGLASHMVCQPYCMFDLASDNTLPAIDRAVPVPTWFRTPVEHTLVRTICDRHIREKLVCYSCHSSSSSLFLPNLVVGLCPFDREACDASHAGNEARIIRNLAELSLTCHQSCGEDCKDERSILLR